MKNKKQYIILIWIVAILVILFFMKDITVENIVNYTPNNLYLTAIIMLALFAIKSLSVVIYSGLLYSAINIMFPNGIDILLCYAGSFIAILIPYIIGKRQGISVLEKTEAKYPKLSKIKAPLNKFPILSSAVLRAIPIFSLDIISAYLGATKMNFISYTIGSLIGISPTIWIYNGIIDRIMQIF